MNDTNKKSLWTATLNSSNKPTKVNINTGVISKSDAERAFKSKPHESQKFVSAPDAASALLIR